MTFGLVLDPPEAPTISGRVQLNLNEGPIRVDQAGIDWGDATIQAFMAEQGRYGSAPVDYIIPNRSISIPLAVFTDEITGITYDEAKRWLTAKVSRIALEGGVLRRTTTSGAYSPVYADIVDATLNFPDIWGEPAEIEVNVHLTLTALPDFYGSEITLDSIASDGVTGDITAPLKFGGKNAVILGDWPARCRVVLSNGTANDQRAVFGGFRGRYSDQSANAALAYEPTVLTPSTGATSQAIAGGTGGTALRISSLPPQIWTPVFNTDLASGGPLTHKGTYRVMARVFTNVGDSPQGSTPPVWVRFSWAVGSTIYQTVNDPLQLQTSGAFWLLDMGQIALQPAPIGTHYWRGVFQVYAPAGGAARDVWVDRIWFVPLDDNSWRPTAPMATSQGVNPLQAWDDFASLGGGSALNGRTPPLGPAWITSAAGGGSSTTDIVGTGTGGVRRATTSDGTAGPWAQGRIAISPTAFTDTEVGGDWMTTAFPKNNFELQPGVLARYTDNSNFLFCGYSRFAGVPQLRLVAVVGGTALGLGSKTIAELPNTWITILLWVYGNGNVVGSVSLQGQTQSPLWKINGYHASLATGGGLASGKIGFIDSNTGTTACTRYYDNVFARNPVVSTRDAVIFGSRSSELRSDGMFRLDSAGVVGTTITRQEGDLPRLPVSGLEARAIDMVVQTSRSDLDALPDQGNDAFTAQVKYRPCWMLGQ